MDLEGFDLFGLKHKTFEFGIHNTSDADKNIPEFTKMNDVARQSVS